MRKLEIGPTNGQRLDKSWETLNIFPGSNVDIVADIRRPLKMIKDDSYDIIYMSHVLEHVPWFNTIHFLKEIRRILKSGGVVEIWVPDFDKLISAYLDNNLIKKDGWYKYNPNKDPMIWLNGRIFTYGPNEDNWHRAIFNSDHLVNCLKKAQFFDIKKLNKPRGYDHGWINLGMSGRKK